MDTALIEQADGAEVGGGRFCAIWHEIAYWVNLVSDRWRHHFN